MRKFLNLFIIFALVLNTNLMVSSPSFAKGIKDAINKSDKKNDKSGKKTEKTETKDNKSEKKENKAENCSTYDDLDECETEDCDEVEDCDDSEDCDESEECDLDEDEVDESEECDSDTCKNTNKTKKTDKKDKTDKNKKPKDNKDSKDKKVDKETKKEPEVNNYDLFFDEIIEETIYPSFVLFSQMNKEMSETPLIYFYIEDENAHVKVTIEENDFMELCISEHDMTKKDECIFSPWIKWKRNALLNADKPGFINFTAVLEVNGKVKNRINKTLTYRSVNEAILGMYEDDDQYTDFSVLLSCFVNEDHPRIDKVLNEIIEKDKKARKISFYGYQGGSDKDVLDQMEWIWNYFAAKGTRYSDITGSSNFSEKVNAQYIRFFEQVIDNNQANCIDGTCMLASFYKKIGLDVNIILIPGHAFLAVAGTERDKEGLPKKLYYLETTMMGEKGQSFKSALKEGEREYKKNADDEAFIVNVENCRAAGIMPLGR